MTGPVKVELSTPAEAAPATPYLGLFLRCFHRCRFLVIAGITYPSCVKLTWNNEDVSLKELGWGVGGGGGCFQLLNQFSLTASFGEHFCY